MKNTALLLGVQWFTPTKAILTIVKSVYDYTLQLISSTPDKEGESCAGTNPLLVGVVGGVICLIIVSQSLIIAFLLLRQKRASRLDSASPPLYP